MDWSNYLENLKQRAKTSHAYQKHQLLGLEIAEVLHDREHRSLYMKLAKAVNGNELLRLARDVADRISVKNRGGYYMRIISQDPAILKILSEKKKKKGLTVIKRGTLSSPRRALPKLYAKEGRRGPRVRS